MQSSQNLGLAIFSLVSGQLLESSGYFVLNLFFLELSLSIRCSNNNKKLQTKAHLDINIKLFYKIHLLVFFKLDSWRQWSFFLLTKQQVRVKFKLIKMLVDLNLTQLFSNWNFILF